MMKTKMNIWSWLALPVLIGGILAADHLDAPGAAGTTTDIADFFAFEPTEGSDRTVFLVDLQTDVLPDLAYGVFDEDVLTEINIDLDGDLVEDRVIQAIPRDGVMYFFMGDPVRTGTQTEVLVDNPLGQVAISGVSALVENTPAGVSLFAGPRQDPFFFDFNQFNAVIGGMAPQGFNPQGVAANTFDGANTLTIGVELPNSLIGTPTGTNALGLSVYKTWVTTHRN